MGWFKTKARTNLGPQNYMYLSAPAQCYGSTRNPRGARISFLMFHRFILKVTKFKLPTLKRFRTKVENVLGCHHAKYGEKPRQQWHMFIRLSPVWLSFFRAAGRHCFDLLDSEILTDPFYTVA